MESDIIDIAGEVQGETALAWRFHDGVRTVWITKYALSAGIKTAERVNQSAGNPGMVTYMNKAGYRETFHKPDWHETEDGAILRAEIMRSEKIASIERQLTKLRSLTFRRKA